MVQGVDAGDGYDCPAGKGMDYVGLERAFGQYDLRRRSAGTVYPRLRGTAVPALDTQRYLRRETLSRRI